MRIIYNESKFLCSRGVEVETVARVDYLMSNGDPPLGIGTLSIGAGKLIRAVIPRGTRAAYKNPC